MADDELELIRNRRLEQLQSKGNYGNQQKSPEEVAKLNAEQDLIKHSILTQALSQDALARLSNLQVAKPDKAKQIEQMIIHTMRTGQIHEKLSDEKFRQLLNQISEQTNKTTSIKFDRRRAAIDLDSD